MDYATMQSILGWAAIAAALIAGGIVGVMLVYDLGKPLWSRLARLWRRSPVECVAAVALLCYCVAWGGGKITFPRTNAEYELLKDNGSYAAENFVAIHAIRHPIVPVSAEIEVWYRPDTSTNDLDWTYLSGGRFDAISSSQDFLFSPIITNASNYNYMVFTTWQPAPAVQTNGVLHVDWVVATNAETAAEATHALVAVPVKTTVVAGQVNSASGVVETVTETLAPQHARVAKTQTEEEYCFEKYAPDTALLVDLDAADTNTVWIVSACTNRGEAVYTIDWGDGAVTSHTSSRSGTKAEHTYAKRGQYVVRLSDNVSQPLYHMSVKISPAISRLLRWGDHVTYADYAFFQASTSPISLPGGELARWPAGLTSANSTYFGCSGLTGEIPAWPTNAVFFNASSTYDGCTGLTGSIPAWPSNAVFVGANYTYRSCSGLTGEIPAWPTNAVFNGVNATYRKCSGLTGAIPAWPTNANLTSANTTYFGCTGLTGRIPAWPTSLTIADYAYYGCTGLTGAWTNDPDELMPAHITKHSNTVSWSSAALRALFYSSWGGTRKEGE